MAFTLLYIQLIAESRVRSHLHHGLVRNWRAFLSLCRISVLQAVCRISVLQALWRLTFPAFWSRYEILLTIKSHDEQKILVNNGNASVSWNSQWPEIIYNKIRSVWLSNMFLRSEKTVNWIAMIVELFFTQGYGVILPYDNSLRYLTVSLWGVESSSSLWYNFGDWLYLLTDFERR